jgi:5-oxoprolinase (ATP-hydrolysing)
MIYIRENAEASVRDLLKSIASIYGTELESKDHMDDGSKIQLKVSINASDGSATFDFTGTGCEVVD